MALPQKQKKHPNSTNSIPTSETTSYIDLLRSNLLTLLVLGLLVLGVFANSLRAEFVSDDIAGIVQNPKIGTLAFITDNLFNFPGRQVVQTVAYLIGGLNPTVFRLITLLLHTANTCLVFLLIAKLSNKRSATYAASIFAVHPLVVEPVVWIAAGSYVYYSFFVLTGLLLHIRSNGFDKYYVSAALSFLVAVIFSAGAVAFPFLVALLELRRQSVKLSLQKAAVYFGMLGALSIPAAVVFGKRATALGATLNPYGLYNPLVQIPTALSKYLELFFWPVKLTLYQSELSTTAWGLAVRWIVLLIFLALLIYLYKKSKTAFFLASLFPLSLLPTLTPFPVAWVVAERYVYLGVVGLAGIIAIFLDKLATNKKGRRLVNIAVALLVLLLSARTIRRNSDWQSQDSLWLATAKYSPSSPNTHNNLGDVYGRRGDLKAAEAEFKKAIELKPDYADAYHNLGNTYKDEGKLDLALESYQKAVDINPTLWQSYQNMAGIYFTAQEYDKAQLQMESALKINPNSAQLNFGLGAMLLKSGQIRPAEIYFDKALTIDPSVKPFIDSLKSGEQ